MEKETKAAYHRRMNDTYMAEWAGYAIDDWQALPWWRRWREWMKG